MGLSLQVTHTQNAHPAFTRVFERYPVIVGRDDTIATCVLPDSAISRVHVSFDIRNGWVVARDAGSTNGTWLRQGRLPADKWIAVGPINTTTEVRIGQWAIFLTVREVATAPARLSGTQFFDPAVVASVREREGAATPSSPPGASAKLGATLASFSEEPGATPSPVAFQNKTEINSVPLLRAVRALGQLTNARNDLVSAVAEAIESVPAAQRPAIGHALLKQLKDIDREPGVRALLERNGVQLLPTLESAAVHSLQELGRWYVGKPVSSAQEVFALANKLKSGIDELLHGILPMLSGLDRFENQMALRQTNHKPDDVAPSSRLPRAPGDAARALFDWTDATDDALRRFRTDIVDLTVHQTAVLNGVMRGVKQLLAELSPHQIEKEFQRQVAKRGAIGRLLGGVAERWQIYTRRHADLADEENEQFRVIFGPEFAAEYKGAVREPGPPPAPAALGPTGPQMAVRR